MKALILLFVFSLPTVAWGDAWVMVCPPSNVEVGAAKLPLSEWEQISAFDTAMICERHRSEWVEEWLKKKGETDWQKSYAAKQSAYFMTCRCMPYEFWWRSQQQRAR